MGKKNLKNYIFDRIKKKSNLEKTYKTRTVTKKIKKI